MNERLSQNLMMGFDHVGAPDQILVATWPGVRLFDVTPVPASRLASSEANKTFASFDRA